ncbi:hypothetical protein C5167_050922 [Papaver somniferum]|uniref:Uncharacterized protein n=1 Tax=Papaver somniferum TaxID=3469 RepID=A0A4Y7KQ22_PAPSO|nr:hypothetical protein C5167_050922 [Papaver somniferum]
MLNGYIQTIKMFITRRKIVKDTSVDHPQKIQMSQRFCLCSTYLFLKERSNILKLLTRRLP